MQTRTFLATLIVAWLFSPAALTMPITIQTFEDGDDIPTTLGHFHTDPYTITDPDWTTVSSFTTDSGNIVHMSPAVTVVSPEWVDDPDDGTIFGVPGNMVTLRPSDPFGAISFIISSAWNNGGAWVSADWTNGSGGMGTVRNPHSGYFPLNQGDLDGVGVGIWAAPGACITSVTIEPLHWGFGQIRTADCVKVPEPGSLSLLGIGLLVLGGFARRRVGLA